jgi:hypothetical protein
VFFSAGDPAQCAVFDAASKTYANDTSPAGGPWGEVGWQGKAGV